MATRTNVVEKARRTGVTHSNHVAAIHVLAAKLKLTEDDYRAVLRELTGGKSSCSQMEPRQLQAVREHLDARVRAAGLDTGARSARRLSSASFEKKKAAASPKERKAWALWHQLGRDGLVANTSAQALNAWVERQVGVSALQFCTSAQLDTVIESLKLWQERGGR